MKMSVLCLAFAAVSAVVGVLLLLERRHFDEDAGVAFFLAGIFPVFAVIARVIERVTPPK